MKILSIETSCDETGVTILECSNDSNELQILSNTLSSQIEIHTQYGGVFPALAKRAHAEKIIPLLIQALDESFLLYPVDEVLEINSIEFLNEKESQLKEQLLPFLKFYKKPDIDYIAVTIGPGLEPALWVGVNTARALATIWNIPVIPINHMEGHIITATLKQISEDKKNYKIENLKFPVLSLLVSGGHTELVLSDSLGNYKKIGQTRDDAIGEAFDKVARMIGLPYPGGPAISKLAAEFRNSSKDSPRYKLPRPMIHSQDYDFSFSGIKTATLYLIRDITAQNSRELTDEEKSIVACEFENAVIEVLIKKTLSAVEEYQIQTLIVGGGVASNTYLRSEFERLIKQDLKGNILFPEPWLATDNAIMIGIAAISQIQSGSIKTINPSELIALGNLSIAN